MKKYIADNNIQFYTIDATTIAKELGLGGRVNTILQAAFFKLSEIIPADKAVELMKAAATKSYGKKGEKIVAMNHAAIERGVNEVKKVNVPADWANAQDEKVEKSVECDRPELKKFVENILEPVNAQLGDNLPVSAFIDDADGTLPQGSAAFEKRGIAVDVPEWNPEACIQCNFCSYVCPHAVIRPYALTADEVAAAPENIKTKPMTGFANYSFAVAISALDCTGCGSCANVCPGTKGVKALTMKPIDTQVENQKVFDYCGKLPVKEDIFDKFKPTTVKGSQFKQPLLEFSGACAGCGEDSLCKACNSALRRQDVYLKCNGLFINLGWFRSIYTLHRQQERLWSCMG